MPQMDPTVVAWFQSVDADRSGRISAVELQQALTNNDWSRFRIQTCYQMIGMHLWELHSGNFCFECTDTVCNSIFADLEVH